MGNSLKHPLHDHELKLIKGKKVDDERAVCEVCHGAFHSKKFYGCAQRCGLYMHRLCAQLPPTITSRTWHKEDHKLSLGSAGEHGESFVCGVCGTTGTRILYSCRSQGCEFHIHPLCAFLPIRIQTHQHEHILVSKMGEHPHSCSICGKDGSSLVHYACETCNYAVHPFCLLEESTREELQRLYRRSKEAIDCLCQLGRKLADVASQVLANLSKPVNLGDAVETAIKLAVLADELTDFCAKLKIGSGENFLTMAWDGKPSFIASEQNKEKIMKELIMLFALHICRMHHNLQP